MAKTVFVGMSGGVDSSVSALLLKKQGYKVVGVYMKNWSQDLPGMKCPWAEDLADAKRVAVKLGIDFLVFDFEKEYKERVVDYMLGEFKKGNTPNPDVMCNQEIKFKLFYEKAMEMGADFIATGHYARSFSPEAPTHGRVLPDFPPPKFCKQTFWGSPSKSVTRPPSDTGTEPVPYCSEEGKSGRTRPSLLRAVDENKDQTYFLYRISDAALARTIFPIGEMKKPEVKKLAEENGLHNAYKKESMGVCFVGEVGMKDFLKEYIDATPGEIREIESEKVLGYHEGAIFYTIGQRHGLYLTGAKGEVNDGMPYYVVKKDIEKNIVYVSKNLNDEHIWTDKLELKDVVMRQSEAKLNDVPMRHCEPATAYLETGLEFLSTSYAGTRAEPSLRDEPVRSVRNIRVKNSNQNTSPNKQLLVRLRHRAPLIPAEFDGKTLFFAEKIKRPASGQSAVLYDGEICLGGGIIA